MKTKFELAVAALLVLLSFQAPTPAGVFQGTGVGPIPDSSQGPGNWGTPLNVNFNVTGVVATIQYVVVSITLNHSWIGDLDVALLAPNGQATHTILSRVGAETADSYGDNSNLGGTYVFADFAGTGNIWTVATNAACGSTCTVLPGGYRSIRPGPTTTPSYTIFRDAFAGVLSPNGTWTLRIRDGAGGDTGSVTAATLTIETYAMRQPFDFDGDDKTDIGIYRPGSSQWWINRSSTGQTYAAQFGTSTDIITPGDFTGDGRTDIAFWRPSNGYWYVLRSEDYSFYAFPFGTTGDIPAPADYTRDGTADPVVFRPSNGTWYFSPTGWGGYTYTQQFGAAGDIPAVADYDADGQTDIAIFRPSVGEWWIRRSSEPNLAVQFGASSDKPVPGDYTGDGRADVAFWRPSTGTWFILRTQDMSYYSIPFGSSGDIPAPGDYDGDRKHDPAVFRPSSSTWFINRTTAGLHVQQFGASSDRPIPNAFVP